jgi:putative peptidoglycan lipid II flippase
VIRRKISQHGGVNRLLAAGALAAFLLVLLVIVIVSATSGGGSSAPPTTAVTTTVARPTQPTTTGQASPKQVAVKLIGTGAYDPEGDQHENDDLAPLAVDGDPATFWKTEHYNKGFFKKGVGLVLDAGRSLGLSRVVVATDTRGSAAQILLGGKPAGPFRPVSADRPLTGTTVYTLNKGAAGRYIVVWITAIPQAVGEAHITEVRASATLPPG